MNLTAAYADESVGRRHSDVQDEDVESRPRWGGMGPRRRPLEGGRQTNRAHMIVWISGAGVGVDLLDYD